MREVNFSIPNVNKASVGITTALYDRRALDCTSTLPLINSLNHLAYLTTSSARIREILTVDGGIERLVCILKEGRSKDMLDMWKWNLAFQCIVNIGVRGTEVIRTRVVEADMVPVIATILDNYIQVIEKCREKADEAKRKDPHRHRSHDGTRVSKSASSFSTRTGRMDVDQRSFRRQAPPPSIDVLATLSGTASNAIAQPSLETTPSSSQHPVSSPPDRFSVLGQRSTPTPQHTPHNRRPLVSPPSSSRSSAQPLASANATSESPDAYVRPVRDTDRLASMTPFGPGTAASQPASPTTPLPPVSLRSPTVRPSSMLAPHGRSRRRPSIRHQHSTAADPDDLNADSMQSDEAPEADTSVADDEMQPGVGIQDVTMEDEDSLLTGASLNLTTPTASEAHEADSFNITHRVPVAVDGSIAAPNTPATVTNIGLSPNRPAIPAQPMLPQPPNVPRYLSDRLDRLERQVPPNPSILAAMPRDEDVMMSLQLLAYVSKYCNLRTYFQKSHMVPRLRIGKELRLLDGADPVALEAEMDEDERRESEEEYLLPNDLNIFPLVEKFTIRYHSTDLQYWAGVVMRNLCRKDESHGGVRQCAYYECNKWEEWPRQFAKCRRCRRTKYCSKECQKNAWIFHRHWCIAAAGNSQ